MKQLYLVRHAKSDWGNPDRPDYERPLNERGFRDAPFMADWLAQQIPPPDRIMASPARRARETAECLSRAFGIPETEITFNDQIYEASVKDLLRVTTQCPDPCETLLLVGHNPGITAYLGYLTGTPGDMATCSIAGIRLDVDSWAECTSGSGRLLFLVHPKQIRADRN